MGDPEPDAATPIRTPSLPRDVARGLLVAGTYYGAARLGLRLALVGESVTPLWPPTGLALVAILAFGYRMWPAVAAAAFLVNLPISPNAAAAAGIALGNTLAPLAAAALLRRVGFRSELERVRDALAIVFLAALLGMLISATIGTTSLIVSDAVPSGRFLETWSVWWTGDAMGVLFVAPFLWWLASLRPLRLRRIRWARAAEALALFALLGGASFLAARSDRSILFSTLPILGGIAWRFQQRGAAPAGLLASSAAVWAAVDAAGPFAGHTLLGKMAVLQGFNAAVAFTSFFFASAVAERVRAREELERAAGELEGAVRRRTSELTVANQMLLREVAEHAEAERALLQREMQLAEAQSIAHLGSWEWDIGTDTVTWSDELYRIYGLHPQEFSATYAAFLERLPAEDRPVVEEIIQNALRDGGTMSFEHRIVRPDGTERTIQARGSVVTGPSGAPVRILGTGQDVTERSLAERALRESEERFRTVFQSAAIGMAECDTAGVILKANLALQRLAGYAEEELQQRTFLDLTHDEDRPRHADLFGRLLRGQVSSFEIEMRFVRGDSGVVWVHSTVSIVRDAAGRPQFVHMIVQDLTERRRAEALQRAEEERERLHEVFSQVPAAVVVTRGTNHTVEFANDAFEELVGKRQCMGKPLRDAVPEMEGQGYFEVMDRVFASGEPFAASEALMSLDRRGDGALEEGFFNLVFQPIRNSSGEIDGMLGHAVEVTETIRGRQRVTESLAFLDTLLRTAPAGFAVFDTELRCLRINERLAAMNELPVEAHLGRTLRELLPELAERLEPSLRRAIDTHEPVVDVEVSRESRSVPGEARHWLASSYPVLTPDGETLGVGLVVVEITERKRSERLLSGQKEALELLARGAKLPDVLDALARLAEEQSAGAPRAAILLVGDEGTHLRLGAAPSLPGPFRHAIDRTAIGPSARSCAAAAHHREPVLVRDVAVDPEWSALRDLALSHGIRAAWAWPILSVDRTVLGTFCLYCAQPRLPTSREHELLDVLTRTTAIAIERDRAETERRVLVEREREAHTRLYEREHRVAETLQRSLLPERLPETPGVLVAARYIPASLEVEVGGDWYDIIPLPGGRLGLAIGDVAGHGVAAAAAMGQMRMALRAYSLEDLPPASALERLNLLLLELQPGAMATLLYAQLDPGTGDMRLASAGHPPPLLLRGPTEAEYVEGGLAPPLGVSALIRYEEVQAHLDPGATLILYTDGLVERRRRPIDAGLALLKRVASEASPELETACDEILAGLLGEGVSDDVAFLALRLDSLAGRRLHLRRPARPATVPEVRRILRRWLVQNGAGDEETYEVLVACTEACTNAVQHAYGPGEGAIEIDISVADCEVEIAVRDDGSWRPPGPSEATDGGRGLMLMRGLMDAVEVGSTAQGTEVRMRRRLGGMVVDG